MPMPPHGSWHDKADHRWFVMTVAALPAQRSAARWVDTYRTLKVAAPYPVVSVDDANVLERRGRRLPMHRTVASQTDSPPRGTERETQTEGGDGLLLPPPCCVASRLPPDGWASVTPSLEDTTPPDNVIDDPVDPEDGSGVRPEDIVAATIVGAATNHGRLPWIR